MRLAKTILYFKQEKNSMQRKFKKKSDKPKYPLHDAVNRNDDKALISLLNLPYIKIDFRKPPYKETALYLAASMGKPNLVKLLLEHGADPALTNRFGKTPLDAAIEFGLRGYREPDEKNIYQEVIQLLKSYTVEPVIDKSDELEEDIILVSQQLSKLGIYSSENIEKKQADILYKHTVPNALSQTKYKAHEIEEPKSWCTIS